MKSTYCTAISKSDDISPEKKTFLLQSISSSLSGETIKKKTPFLLGNRLYYPLPPARDSGKIFTFKKVSKPNQFGQAHLHPFGQCPKERVFLIIFMSTTIILRLFFPRHLPPSCGILATTVPQHCSQNFCPVLHNYSRHHNNTIYNYNYYFHH